MDRGGRGERADHLVPQAEAALGQERQDRVQPFDAHSGLSHADFHVLNALADSPGQHLPVSDLAPRIGWERSRLSHHLLRMAERGLVARRRADDDARVTEVALSPYGGDALERATPSHVELVKQLFFDGLDPALLACLHRGLEQIHDRIVLKGSLPPPPGHQTRWVGEPPPDR